MKLRKSLVLALLLMASMVCFSAMAQESDKITQAVMKVYNDHIDKNPNDYNALFMRANQLYYNNDFKGAMNDVNRTIELAPEKETELLFDAYLLRATLHGINNNLTEENNDIEKAAAIAPSNLAWVGMKGNWAYKSGDYELAKHLLNESPVDVNLSLGRI